MKSNRKHTIKYYQNRNANLIEDYSAGMSIVRLVSKYQISSARIYKIIEVTNPPIIKKNLTKPTVSKKLAKMIYD